jgi:hypothetical protein
MPLKSPREQRGFRSEWDISYANDVILLGEKIITTKTPKL